MAEETQGTLKLGEPHPAALDALQKIRGLGLSRIAQLQESFSSCAIEGNRFAEVCGETLNRMMASQPVSDRYVLGLAWGIFMMMGQDGGRVRDLTLDPEDTE